jgi:hypothetical protein
VFTLSFATLSFAAKLTLRAIQDVIRGCRNKVGGLGNSRMRERDREKEIERERMRDKEREREREREKEAEREREK